MNVRVTLALAVAEAGALVAYFYYAAVARDIYLGISEFDPGDELVRYVEWNTYAREALLVVVLLWLIAIAFAIRDYARVRKSLSALAAYRPAALTTLVLLLPVAALAIAWVFELYLPRD